MGERRAQVKSFQNFFKPKNARLIEFAKASAARRITEVSPALKELILTGRAFKRW